MLQRNDTDSFPFLCSRLVLVKRVQIVRRHVSIVELDNGYAVCRLKNFRMLYWITDANDMQYVNHTHAQTKFSIEHTRVGLAHARPIMVVSTCTHAVIIVLTTVGLCLSSNVYRLITCRFDRLCSWSRVHNHRNKMHLMSCICMIFMACRS